MKKGVFLKSNLQYTTPIIWGGRVAKSDVSPQHTLLSVCGDQEGGITPISRHHVYVPPNRVQCFFFASLTHPLSVEKRYMHSLLKFDSGTGLVFPHNP